MKSRGYPGGLPSHVYQALPEHEKAEHRAAHRLLINKLEAERIMRMVDAWPKDIREVAHELGHAIVKAFWDCGVRKPKQIHQLVSMARNEQLDGRPAGFGNPRSPGWKTVTRHHDDKSLSLPARYAGATPNTQGKTNDRT